MKRLSLKFTFHFLTCVLLCSLNNVALARDPGSISVDGEAEILVVPDEAVVIVGVEAREKTAAAATQKIEAAMKKGLKAVMDAGIPAKDFKTDFYTISAETVSQTTSYSSSKENEIIYAARKSLQVSIKDLSKYEPLLAKLIDSGMNAIHNIEFRTSKLRENRDKARSLAIRAALEKAKAMANEAGAKLGPARVISENGWYSGGAMNSWGATRLSNSQTQNVVISANQSQEAYVGETNAFGTIRVSARVSMSFDLN